MAYDYYIAKSKPIFIKLSYDKKDYLITFSLDKNYNISFIVNFDDLIYLKEKLKRFVRNEKNRLNNIKKRLK